MLEWFSAAAGLVSRRASRGSALALAAAHVHICVCACVCAPPKFASQHFLGITWQSLKDLEANRQARSHSMQCSLVELMFEPSSSLAILKCEPSSG